MTPALNPLYEFLRRISQPRPVAAPISAELDPESTPDGTPLYRTEVADTAPSTLEQMLQPVQITAPQPSAIPLSNMLNLPPEPNDLAWARQLGRAVMPPPSTSSTIPGVHQLTAQGRPRLGNWLENFMIAESARSQRPSDPFAGQLAIADYRKSQQAEQDAYETQRIQTGLGLAKDLDTIAQSRTNAERAAALNESAIAENYAQAANQRRLAAQAPAPDAPRVVGGSIAIPDPAADGGWRFLTPPASANAADLSFEEAQQQRISRQMQLDELAKQRPLTPAETAEKAALAREIQAATRTRSSLADPSAREALQSQREFQRSDILRNDYEKAINDDRKRSDAYRDLTSAVESGGGDLAVIYSFIKMMDPNAVREGEIALAQHARGVLPEWLLGLWDQTYGGRPISPATRKQLVSQAHQLYATSVYPRLKSYEESYQERARRAQVNPLDVTRGLEMFPAVQGGGTSSLTPAPASAAPLEERMRRIQSLLGDE